MSNSKNKIKNILTDKNFLVSFITIIFSLSMWITTSDASSSYPYIVFGLILGLGVILMVNVFYKQDLSSVTKLSRIELVFLIVLLINPLFAKYIGFYVTAFIELFVISIFFISERSFKEIAKVFVFSLVVVAVSYFVFKYGLRIRCPRGVLGLI